MDIAKLIAGRVKEFQLHPLGFFYLYLADRGDMKERVHVWTSDLGIADNEYHSHSFDISSKILKGKMRTGVYSFLENKFGKFYQYTVSYQNSESKLERTEVRGSLEVSVEFDNSPGTEYFLSAGIIHKVQILSAPCISVLKTYEKNKEIFSYGETKDIEPPFTRRLVNNSEADEISEVLASV